MHPPRNEQAQSIILYDTKTFYFQLNFNYLKPYLHSKKKNEKIHFFFFFFFFFVKKNKPLT